MKVNIDIITNYYDGKTTVRKLVRNVKLINGTAFAKIDGELLELEPKKFNNQHVTGCYEITLVKN